MLFCIVQLVHYRRYSHSIVHGWISAKTLEYQESVWFEANMKGERHARGTGAILVQRFRHDASNVGMRENNRYDAGDIIAAI